MAVQSNVTQLNVQAMIADLVANNVGIFCGAGAPTNGTSGTGVGLAGPGSIWINLSSGTWYRNTNTIASPTWTAFS